MSKGIAILGLILLIVGILPIILTLVGFPQYAAFFYLGFISIDLAGIIISELMIVFIVLGVIFLILGIVR